MNKGTDSASGVASSSRGPRIHRATSGRVKKCTKILVVDDNKVILRTTASKLKEAGYEVLTAEDGSSAIRQVRQLQPDLIVLDLNFPPDVGHGGGIPWDGFLILSWLRQMVGAAKTPVIVITGGDVEKYKDRWEESGVLDVFLKPIDLDALLAAIRWNLEKEGAAQDLTLVAQIEPSPAEPSLAIEPAPRPKILFVDDTNDWRYLATTYLGDHGYEVATAEDPISATVQASEFKPDLVILDLNLSGQSGVVVLNLLSEHHPEMPVLIYTGMDLSNTEISELLKQGATTCLRKGSLEELVTAVERILTQPKATVPQRAAVLPAEKKTAKAPVAALASGSHAPAQRTAGAPEYHCALPSLDELQTGTTQDLLTAAARVRSATPDLIEAESGPDCIVPSEVIESAAESILIVEDDAAFADTLRSFLESQSFRVSAVTSGEAALSVIAAVDVDLILFDLTLPDIPVEKFYNSVKAARPHLCQRMIFMTSDDSHPVDDGFVRRQKGISVWKPFQMDWLLEAVQTVRGKAQQGWVVPK